MPQIPIPVPTRSNYHSMDLKQTTSVENNITTINNNLTQYNKNLNKINLKSLTLYGGSDDIGCLGAYNITLYTSGYTVYIQSFSTKYNIEDTWSVSYSMEFTLSGTKKYYVPLFSINHYKLEEIFTNSAIHNMAYNNGFFVGQTYVRKNTTGNMVPTSLRIVRYVDNVWYLIADTLSGTTKDAEYNIETSYIFGPTQHISPYCN